MRLIDIDGNSKRNKIMIVGERSKSYTDELQDQLKQRRKDMKDWAYERERAIEKGSMDYKKLCEDNIKEAHEDISILEAKLK